MTEAFGAAAATPIGSLAALQTLGLELPGPAYIVGAIAFGLVGLWAFRQGRKNAQTRTLWLGIALMVYPYAVSDTVLLYGLGAAMCAGLWWIRR